MARLALVWAGLFGPTGTGNRHLLRFSDARMRPTANTLTRAEPQETIVVAAPSDSVSAASETWMMTRAVLLFADRFASMPSPSSQLNGVPDVSQTQGDPQAQRVGFGWLIAYLVFEYLRPQDLVPAIGYLHPAWIMIPFMVRKWPKGGFRSARCPQISIMLIVSCMLVVSIPFVANHFRAYQTTLGYVLMLPFCISIIIFVNTPARVLSFVRWWTFLAVYVACQSIVHPGGMGWGSNFLGDRNDVALLLDMMLPFALCLFNYERTKLRKITCLAVFALCLAGVISTTSRGGFVGLLAVMIVVWLGSSRKVLTLVLVAIVALGTYELAPPSYWNRISSIEQTDEQNPNDSTAKQRLDSWRAAWEMFKDHPLGVGPSQFAVHFPEYQGGAFGAHNMWGREAHSLWFTLLAELGIPGAILYLLYIRANFKTLRQLNRLEDAQHPRFTKLLTTALFASFVGFFAAGTFLSVLYYPHYWYMSALLVAAERSMRSIGQAARQLPGGISGPRIA